MTSSKSIALMFTDIVGYSQMIAKNEANALKLLDEHNKIIFPIIEKNQGKVIKLIGDSIFAKFASSEKLIIAAISIQTELKDRNNIRNKNDSINIRVGLHKGYVIDKDNDLFGHDVNLCSRIESVTQSGSITISEEMFQSITNVEDIFHRKIGFVKLKNIPHPKLLYKTYLDFIDYNSETDKELYDSFINKGIDLVDIDTYEAEKIISLGVTYFSNLGDKNDEYFCYNFTKDLIDNLQTVNLLRIPSINEISKYKNTELTKFDIARKLEVEKLILGSIIVDNNIAKLNIELIDTGDGESLWESSININLKKTLHVHKLVIEKVFDVLKIDIPDHLQKQFIIQSTDNLDAEKEYKKARYLMRIENKKEDLIRADELLKNSIKLDPGYLYAHTRRAMIAYKLGDFDRSEELLNKALEIAQQDGSNISDGYVYSVFGDLYNLWSKYNKALKYNKMALSIYSNLNKPLFQSIIMHNLGNTYLHIKELNNALKYYKDSLKIKQKYEERLLSGTSLGQIGNVYLSQNNFSEAMNYLNRSLSIFEDFNQNFQKGLTMIFLIEAYIETEQFNIASKMIKDAKNILNEYKNPTIEGRLSLYKGLINFYSLDFDKAIVNIELSIHQYQSAQKLLPAFKGYLLLIQIYIYKKQLKKLDPILKKIETLENQIKDEESLIRYKIISCLVKTLNNGIDIKEGEDFFNQFLNMEKTMDNSIAFWNLSLILTIYSDYENAKKSLINAQKILKDTSQKNSEEAHWDKILYTNPINKEIMNQTPDTIKDYVVKLVEKKKIVDVSKFCSECGFKNINLKPFCSDCGNDLKL